MNIPVLGTIDHERYRPYCEWQTLNLLVSLGLLGGLLDEEGSSNAALDQLLGLPARWEGAEQALALTAQLQLRHASLQHNPPALPQDTRLAAHIAELQTVLGLTELEAQLLHWRCLLRLFPGFGDLAELIGGLSALQTLHVLALVTQATVPALNQALAPDNKLARSGLLQMEVEHRNELQHALTLKEGFADQLMLPRDGAANESVMSLFSDQFAPAKPPALLPRHYDHLAPQMQLLEAMLQAALQSRRSGVNVLIHGAPGTGKTQLAAVIAAQIGASLYELALTTSAGKPIRGQDRLGSYRLAQALLAGAPRTLLLFDEVEDVFRLPNDDDKGGLGIKAWINQCLESNPVPAFWITNRVGSMDPAYLRRFDLVMELERPPLPVRRELLREQTASLALPAVWLEQVAQAPGWSPAQLSRAVAVVQSLQHSDAASPCAPQPALTQLLNGSLNAMGLPLLPKPQCEPEGDGYLLDYANTEVDLQALLDGLQRQGRGRLLFHGPPGTGKSGFARHIALALDLPLQIERASTLLSAYVGETERNLAKAFARAQADGAALLIDEVDSLLQQRQVAVRNWEVSQVNELLLQLEGFKGVFIGTTNRLDALDPAVLRRFDLKLGFAPLRDEQAMTLLMALAEAVSLCPEQTRDQALRRKGELTDLTVGDFRAFSDQCELIRPPSPQALLDGLLAAAPHRDAVRTRIGFTA